MFISRKLCGSLFFLAGVFINLAYSYNLNPGRYKSRLLVPNIRGIYVHIPFCRRRCYYCDFPIVVVGDGPRNQQFYIQNYINLLMKEFDATKRFLSDFRCNANDRIDSIYFGGGTPSLLDVSDVNRILDRIKQDFRVSPEAEVTLEMDPGTFNHDKLVSLASVGINRVSMGVQSFDAKLLELAGRAHSLDDVYRAIDSLHSSPISNFNIDLICSLPNSTLSSWRNSLLQAKMSGASHISVYDLQIEERTAFGKWYTPGEFPLPNEIVSRQMYLEGHEILSSNGCFEHYEVSNYAKVTDGESRRSIHNQKYWNCQNMLAFGMAAVSYINGARYTRPKKLSDYSVWVNSLFHENVTAILSSVWGIDKSNDFPIHDIYEYVMLALRTSDGLKINDFRDIFGKQAVEKLLRTMKHFIEDNLMEFDQVRNVLKIRNPEGFIVSNDIISSIFTVL